MHRRYWLHWRAFWCYATMGVATLALCSYANSWSHTSVRVTGLQPFTLVLAHSHHARHWSHHRISGVDCTAPHDPTNCPYGLVRPRAVGLSVSCISPPPRPTPSSCLRGRPSSVLWPNQSPHLSTGEPPATSWIFLACHSYTALVFITPSVDLRIHYVVHLLHDRFLHRSSGRLRVGKAAKVVAPIPSSETKCYALAERCGVAQYLGRERHGFPK